MSIRLLGNFLNGPWPSGAMYVHDHGEYWDAHGFDSKRLGCYASREQAVAALVAYAAPWIARELVEEVKP